MDDHYLEMKAKQVRNMLARQMAIVLKRFSSEELLGLNVSVMLYGYLCPTHVALGIALRFHLVDSAGRPLDKDALTWALAKEINRREDAGELRI